MMMITLNIGGTIFLTTKETLSTGSHFFSNLVQYSNDTNFFIDRDGTHFRFVLNFLRGSTHLPKQRDILLELLHEADFYCLQELKINITRLLPKSVGLIEEEINRIADKH